MLLKWRWHKEIVCLSEFLASLLVENMFHNIFYFICYSDRSIFCNFPNQKLKCVIANVHYNLLDLGYICRFFFSYFCTNRHLSPTFLLLLTVILRPHEFKIACLELFLVNTMIRCLFYISMFFYVTAAYLFWLFL